MSDNKRYCMGCMKLIKEDAAVCPHCHYPADSRQDSPYLSQGSKIAERYIVGKVISMSNDSITYIGLDVFTGEPINICEYYPHKIAHRANDSSFISPLDGYNELYSSCLQSFLGLWRGIKMFDDVRCLPKVKDILTGNDSAYCIYESKECMPLKDYFAKTRKPLTYTKAIAAFMPLLNALKLLHNAGIVHGNITPSTIQVGTDGRLNLSGFSIPQCRSKIRELASNPVSGFSPVEIYETGEAKKESDIYSVMAVLYYSITGTVLPKSTERIQTNKLSLPSSLASAIPKNVLDAMARSLAVYPHKRISTVDELIRCLKAAPAEHNNNMSRQQSSENVRNNNNQTITKEAMSKKQVQNKNTKTAANRKPQKKAKQKEPSFLGLGIVTFVAAVMVISILFCALYTTVLYKSIDIPFLNEAFSSVSFLPINKREDNDVTEDVDTTTSTLPPATETSYATVADFTKLNYDYIISNESFKRNFVLKFKEEASDTVKKGGIIRQDATAGESVPVGTEIVLVVSTGKEQVVVPDVKGKAYAEAKEILEEAKFKVSKELIDNEDNKTPDEVYRMSVDAGQSVDKGTEIVLTVWDKVPETTTEETTESDTYTTKETKPSTTKKADTTEKSTTKKPSAAKSTTTKQATSQD